MKRTLTTIVALAAAVTFAGTLRAAYNEIGTAFPMSGPTDFIAEVGVTNVYTGLISGTGPAVIKGGGTVAFSNANNTYTGGTIVSNAVFRLDADGCAGTAGITGAVDTAHVFIDCANVPNELIFVKGGWSSNVLKPGAYPAAQQYPIFPMRSEVSIEGKVSFGASTMIYDYTSPDLVSPAPTVTYKKDVSTVKEGLHLVPAGRMIFEGKYISSGTAQTSLGYKSNAYGTMEFHASSNTLRQANLYNADLDFRAVDAFPSTLFYYESGSANYCKTFLNGNNQTILGICWKSPTPGETATGMCITSAAPAVVRIVGCEMGRIPSAATLVNRLALFGDVSLIMDIASSLTSAGFYQEFSVRKSTTTGDLIISNGDFRVSGSASFPNVPNVYVGEGGSFTNASTKPAAFAGCRNLTVLGTMACTGDATPFENRAMTVTLGADAKFSLPVGATVTVTSLTVGGAKMPDGPYGDGGTALDQIEQGTVIVRGHDRYVDCNTTDTVNDGSKAHPHKTIKAATESAMSGDVIHVAPGTYGAAEGTQTATSKIAARVVVPENVTIESTGGAKETFIVGAAATGDQIDNATYGTGTNAVRCVYARSGAVVRGFTLTGGRARGGNGTSDDDRGAAFFSVTERAATVEECIISNNASAFGVINKAIIRNCLVVGNVGTRSNYSGAAGASCSWYGSIIDNNVGTAPIYDSPAFENCTVGTNNKEIAGGTPQVLFWWYDGVIVNSAVLGGRINIGNGCKLYCTNSLFTITSSLLKEENLHNTIITNLEAARLDSAYRPVFGSFAGMDAGDVAYSSELIGSVDLYGTPRILNAAMDIGAVEYDWRPAFAAEFGKRFTVTYASPMVTTNAVGGLRVTSGYVAGKVISAGPYEMSFNVTGGILDVYIGSEKVATCASLPVVQSICFTVPNVEAEIRFVFTPDVEGEDVAILRKFSVARGFSITFR